jgi:hypothetical protein
MIARIGGTALSLNTKKMQFARLSPKGLPPEITDA